MACFHPLRGYRSGNGGITFRKAGSTGLEMSVPCGQCIGCRLERSRQWAMRMLHEASLHEDNCFLTLTYADEHLPRFGSLDKRAFPLFMKRLRKSGVSARYFHCGEYGETNGRPHYHACLFGYGFPDRVFWTNRGGNKVWRSPFLERLWPFGQSEIGSLTFESAAYVARYVTKKVTGGRADDHYTRVDSSTGELVQLEPEYATMSRRPGIGAGWFEKYADEVFPSDEVIVRGRPCKPPRYYHDLLSSQDPPLADSVSRERRRNRDREDQTPERLQVRKVCTEARISHYSREVK